METNVQMRWFITRITPCCLAAELINFGKHRYSKAQRKGVNAMEANDKFVRSCY